MRHERPRLQAKVPHRRACSGAGISPRGVGIFTSLTATPRISRGGESRRKDPLPMRAPLFVQSRGELLPQLGGFEGVGVQHWMPSRAACSRPAAVPGSQRASAWFSCATSASVGQLARDEQGMRCSWQPLTDPGTSQASEERSPRAPGQLTLAGIAARNVTSGASNSGAAQTVPLRPLGEERPQQLELLLRHRATQYPPAIWARARRTTARSEDRRMPAARGPANDSNEAPRASPRTKERPHLVVESRDRSSEETTHQTCERTTDELRAKATSGDQPMRRDLTVKSSASPSE